MTPAQCRAARALLGMTQSQLGFAAVVPLGAIIDFEAEATTPKDEDLDAIQDALEFKRLPRMPASAFRHARAFIVG